MIQSISSKFLSICLGISLVLGSLSLFIYSIQPSYASVEPNFKIATQESGTNENYIPLGIKDGYAYWVVFNTVDGYKFRYSKLSGGQWVEKK